MFLEKIRLFFYDRSFIIGVAAIHCYPLIKKGLQQIWDKLPEGK